MADEQRQPVVELRGITKRFGRLVANDGVDFDLKRGEVHALLGENGAGKSTLMSILYGYLSPDHGQIVVEGEIAEIDAPSTAVGLGFGMVHQHFLLVSAHTVTENIVLGDEPRTRSGLLDPAEARRRVLELAEDYGLGVDPDGSIEGLGVGAQQRVEILRALYRDARILILDEPTAVLTAQETTELFAVLRALRDDGVSIVLISHKLTEVMAIADRITVLRQGRKVDTVAASEATERGLARLMVGRDVLLRVEKSEAKPGPPGLEVESLSVVDDRGLDAVRGVSLSVRQGEIVALAGVDGNGQSQLVEAVAGLREVESGRVRLGGHEITDQDPRRASAAGVAYIPEDRRRRGLVLDFSLAENLCLRSYCSQPLSRFGWLYLGRMAASAEDLLNEYDVRGGGAGTVTRSLSGGNQQKLTIAREIATDPSLLIAHQPTRGLDVGAIEFVHKRIVTERDAGRAVLLVSLDYEEVRSLADRILVMYEGELAAEFGSGVSEEELGFAMSGASRSP